MWGRLLVAGVAGLVVSACQSVPAPEPEVWIRTDGQRGTGNPVLEQQFEIDKAVCVGQTQQTRVGMVPIYYGGMGGSIGAVVIEAQRSAALMDVAKGCMAQRGYLRVPVSQAASTREQFARNTKTKSRSP
jgi:hypothetical protein